MQRLLAARHLGLAVFRRDQLNEIAVIRLAWHDRSFFALPRLDQQVVRRHHILATGLRFGRLMTPLAIRLKNRSDVFVKADAGKSALRLLFSAGNRENRKKQTNRNGACNRQFHFVTRNEFERSPIQPVSMLNQASVGRRSRQDVSEG